MPEHYTPGRVTGDYRIITRLREVKQCQKCLCALAYKEGWLQEVVVSYRVNHDLLLVTCPRCSWEHYEEPADRDKALERQAMEEVEESLK